MEEVSNYLRAFRLVRENAQTTRPAALGAPALRRSPQFHAVRAAIAQVIAASRPISDARVRGKGGVVWHTQGSGKSITMARFAARVMQGPAMENPTIVVPQRPGWPVVRRVLAGAGSVARAADAGRPTTCRSRSL